MTSIRHPTITLYTSAVCGYCVAAKNFLRSKGLAWEEVRVDAKPEERSHMVARTGRTTQRSRGAGRFSSTTPTRWSSACSRPRSASR